MKYIILVLFLPFFLAGCIPSANNVDKNIENNPIDVRPEGWQPSTSTEEIPQVDNSKPGAVRPTGEEDQKIVSIDMTAKKWDFQPSTVTVTQGDIVRLNINSVDVTHGIALPDFGVDTRLEPGKTTSIEFVADKKGSFTFSCNVYCGAGHKDMKGTLIVE